MRVVYKYELPQPGETATLRLPAGWRCLAARQINDRFYMWVESSSEDKTTLFTFAMYGTGRPVVGKHIATVFEERRPHMVYVWHLYQL